MKLSAAVATVFLAAQIPGWIPFVSARETIVTVPRADARYVIRGALREFDRFLDHHLLIEEQLRLDPGLMENPALLEENPELLNILRANPEIVAGLKVYPRYFLYRALQRQAGDPLSFRELAPFKELFREQPQLEKELTQDPELLRDPAFRKSHALLDQFFARHAVLARAFSIPTNPSPPR